MFASQYLKEVGIIASWINSYDIESLVDAIAKIKQNGGRLFFAGNGGSAATASHAVNDFRKIANIESYAISDNVAELTARNNDEGWKTVFVEWLRTSHLSNKDGLIVLSVGGGSKENNMSPNIIEAIDYANSVGSKVLGIVGRNGGYTGEHSDIVVFVPIINDKHITPHSEEFQSVILHLLVSHPKLHEIETKWESLASS